MHTARALAPYALLAGALAVASVLGGAYARATQAAVERKASIEMAVEISEENSKEEGIDSLIARMRAMRGWQETGEGAALRGARAASLGGRRTDYGATADSGPAWGPGTAK